MGWKDSSNWKLQIRLLLYSLKYDDTWSEFYSMPYGKYSTNLNNRVWLDMREQFLSEAGSGKHGFCA